MIHNVRHTHILVKRECSWGALGAQRSPRDNVSMSKTHRPHHLRAWRKRADMTLVQVSEQVNLTHSQLSKIERGKEPYNQKLLEALAAIYECEVADLLLRDPEQSENIWSIWDRARPDQRHQIEAVAATILRTGTK